MTKSRIAYAQPERTLLIVSKETLRAELADRIELAGNLTEDFIRNEDELSKAKGAYYSWDDYNLELLKNSFNNPSNEYRNQYKQSTVKFFGGADDFSGRIKEFHKDIETKCTQLAQLASKLNLIPSSFPQQTSSQTIDNTLNSNSTNGKIFIVHGHNNEIKLEVARLISKLGLEPIILHEQANQGRTIIEKFQHHSDVGFAVVILTDDDLGKAKSVEELKDRARQNVILELGFFIGKLGRTRVCPLYKSNVELPSDLIGLGYVELDNHSAWELKLGKELREAGYSIDLNKL